MANTDVLLVNGLYGQYGVVVGQIGFIDPSESLYWRSKL